MTVGWGVRRGWKLLLSCGLVLGLVLSPAQALACAICGCGDPTLTVLGTEQPYQHRVRVALATQSRWDRLGRPGIDALHLFEQRLDASLAYAPIDALFLTVLVPFMYREVTEPSLARTTTTAIGDVEVRAKWFVWHDDSYPRRHWLAITGGLKVPTAPVMRRQDGALLPVEMQPGTGSFDPSLGLSYAFSAHPVAIFSSVFVSVPTFGTDRYRASPSVRGQVAAQHEVGMGFVLRAGLDFRIDALAEEAGRTSRDAGGLVGYVSPDILWSALPDLTFIASARLPVLQALRGFHREGPILLFTVAYDLN